jgi:hypothetical protein
VLDLIFEGDAIDGVAVFRWMIDNETFEERPNNIRFEDTRDEMGVEAFGFVAIADDENVFLIGNFDVRSAFARNEGERSGGKEWNGSDHDGMNDG